MQDYNLAVVLRMELEDELFPDGMNTEQIKILDRVEQKFNKAYQAGYKDAQLFSSVEWSNNACLGYVILGAKNISYTDKQIASIVHSVYREFDFKTIEEAKQAYERSHY
ncbi:hypothetical protein [Paenibacillus aceti]|uniref:DUF4288 domain-containing protein n=1 Tax=Paenibacillus aceti TaxID=1820010 RepID=A0ABQ1VQC3_9BACL|nr:hypothetical protein [Paenibacillus aceti]GGF86581.1 hypothetical protein GCM10010913_05130 [Paenibacillus aceti]